MKKDIHPEYREVLFHDTGADKYFLIRSTLETTQTKEWDDGKTYPYYPVEISSASHPFYTGKQKIIDTGGRTTSVQLVGNQLISGGQVLQHSGRKYVYLSN